MSLEDYKNKRRTQCLSEAVDSYNRLADKGMFDKIKENWEFKWIYDEKQKNHEFNTFNEFKSYCELQKDKMCN